MADIPAHGATAAVAPPEAAFSLLFAHRSMLRAYVHAIVRDPTLIEDTLSEVVVEIARSYARYDPALPFAPWARGVARRVTLASLRKHGRAELTLPEETIEELGASLDRQGDQAALELRKERLRACLEKLTPGNRRLVELRYFEELQPEAIAARVQRSLGALYTAYSRIHGALQKCMERSKEAA